MLCEKDECKICNSWEEIEDKFCSCCVHSEYNENYPDTVPSIYTCHNEKSEKYGTVAWCSICDLFEFDIILGKDTEADNDSMETVRKVCKTT